MRAIRIIAVVVAAASLVVHAAHAQQAGTVGSRRIDLQRHWKFVLDNEEMLKPWARRYGESGALALAEELRGLAWRARRE